MSNIDDFLDSKAAETKQNSQIDTFLDASPPPAEPGFIPTIKRTAGQMLTTAATTADDVIGPNAVTKAVRETGQGIIDRNPAGITKLADVVDSPWLTVKEAVGQFAPQIGAATAGGFAGARAGGALGALAGPGGAAAGAAIGGVAGSLLPIFTQEYGGIRQEQKEAGQEDKGRALDAAIPATVLERVGMGKAFNVLKGVPVGASSILKEAGKGVLKEGATEGAQNVIEQWGAFKDPTTGENLQDTALSAVMGGIGGGVAGGAGGAVDLSRQSAQKPADAQADTQPPTAEQVPESPDLSSSPIFQRAAPTWTVSPDGTVRTADNQEAGDTSTPTPKPEPVKPSEAMGLDPAAGPLSAAAVMAVDDGAHQATKDAEEAARNQAQAQKNQAQSAIEKVADKPGDLPAGSFETAQEAQDYISAQKRAGGVSFQALPMPFEDGTFGAVTKGSPGYEKAQAFKAQQDLRDAGVLDTDVLNLQGRPFPTIFAAKRAAFEAGADFEAVKLAPQQFVVRQTGALNGASPDISPLPAADAGTGRADAGTSVAPGMGLGAADAGALGAGSAADQQNGGVVSPANGADAGAITEAQTHVQNTPPRTQTEPQAQTTPGEAPAVARTDAVGPAATGEQAGSANVEAAGITRIDDAAHAAATSPLNSLPEPTEAQKKAGNYPKGHMTLNGLDLAIQNPAGSVRRGIDRKGKAWENQIQHHYGYIKGTVGNDKDHVDLFVKPETPLDYSGPVFVVDQVHPDTGKFDEHKVIVGAKNVMEARHIYRSNYAKGWKGLKSITSMPFDEFKTWVKDGPKNKPLQPIATTPSTTQKGPAHEPQANKAEPQQTQQQKTPAGALAGTGTEVAQPRAANWRGNFLQAAKVARELKIDPKGKKLAVLVGEIDARDAGQNADPTQSSRAEAAIEKIAEAKPSAVPESKPAPRGVAAKDEAGNVAMFSRSASTKTAYEARIDALFSGGEAARMGVRVLDRSDVLGLLGYPDQPMVLAESKVRQGQDNHQRMTAETWKKIPGWLDDPAAVFVSDTVDGRLVFIAPEMVNGSPVRIIVEPNAKVGALEVHLLVNAFDATGRTPWMRWASDGLTRYMETKKFPEILAPSGLQLSRVEQASRGTGKILTQKNLAGYRRANGAAFSFDPQALQRGPSQEDIRKTDELFRAARPKKSTVQDVRKAINQLVNGLGMLPNKLGRIVVATSEDIQADWVPLIGPVDIKSESEGDAQGFYSPKTRTVFLIADHINQGDEMGVVAHELMHKHGQDVLGKAGWDKLHGTIEGWKSADAASMERQVYDEAASRVKASGAHLSNQELFPYAVQVALEMGVRPNELAKAGTVARWLAGVRHALRQAWTKITNKPDQFKAQDMVNLAFGIAQMENPDHAPDMKRALDRQKAGAKPAGQRGTNAPVTNPKEVVGKSQDGRSADDTTPGVRAARQILEAIEQDNDFADYALRVIPGEFKGAIKIGDTLPASKQWENGNETNEHLDGTSAVRIRNLDEKSVIEALKNLGALGKNGPNGYYFGNRIALVKGESIGSGEDVGESIIKDAEVVGIWEKPSHGLSEINPNESTAPDSGGASFRGSDKTSAGVTANNTGMPEEKAIEALKGADELFALPKSASDTVQGIAADNNPNIKVKESKIVSETLYTLTLPDGGLARIWVRPANPYGERVYSMELQDGEAENKTVGRPGENPEVVDPNIEDVYVDVSNLKPGGAGATVYNIAATFARNTGRIFIGDPSGLSNMAMRRRTENMISTALKFGTTDHIAPHPYQVRGDSSIGVPPLKWVYGDTLGNIKRMIDVSLKSMDTSGHAPYEFDPATGYFSDPGDSGSPVAGVPGLAAGRLQDISDALRKRSGTRARAAIFNALLRQPGSEGKSTLGGRDELLARLVHVANQFPDSTEGIFYSRGNSRVDTAPDSGVAKFGGALKSITVTDLKTKAGLKLADYRGLGLQFLGGRQINDLYAKDLPQLESYTNMVQQMSADANDVGANADKVATTWGKLKDERQLAELMHDATLAQIDPAKEFVTGDNRLQWGKLNAAFKALTPEAQAVYTQARDGYEEHYANVREAIRDKIERSDLASPAKAAMLERMDAEFFEKIKGVYFPLARFGQYVVVTRNPGGEVVNVSRAESLNEAENLRATMRKAYPGFTVGKVLKDKEFNAARDSVGRGFLKDLFGVLDEEGVGEELQDAVNQLYLASMPDLSWAKHGIHRKGTPGFSQDARRAYAQNMFHGARYLAKLRYADQLQEKLADMQRFVDAQAGNEKYDSVKGQQIVDELNKRNDSLMNPKSNPLATALTSFGFVFHLGLSPASAMVNLSQTALVAYPVMGAKWGYDKAAAALAIAGKQAAANKNDISSALNADERRAYDEAVKAGTIDVTNAHDLAGIAQGEDAGVMWKMRPVMKWASFLFHHAERFNRQITFVASYRLARAAGANHETAYQQATKATYDGHFDYASANRPRVMQSPPAKVLLLFKQFGQNMVYTLARQAQLAMNAETPAGRKEARRALAGLLVMHASAAGVLGLPLVGTLLAAASMIGGSDDEPWDAETALRNMLADTFGQKPAEVMARGFSRLTPWDVSRRVGLDSMILPDLQEGLQGKRLAETAMSAALGPVAGIGTNVLKGMQEISEGRLALGLETMMPAVLRGPMKALRYEQDGAKDKSGIVIKDEVSAGGIIGQALGFAPSEVRNATEGRSAIFSADKRLGERRSDLMDQYANAHMKQDGEGMEEARADIQKFNEKNPSRKINGLQLMQSVRNRQRRIDQAKDGIYLAKNRNDARQAGQFASVE